MHLQSIFISEGVNDLTPYSLSNSLKNFGILCELPFTGELCKTVLFNMFGPSVQYFDGFLLNLSKHYPAGSSYKQFIHYGQLIATGNKFNRIPGTAKTEEFSFKELCVSEQFHSIPISISIARPGKFQKFHYNATKNMELYGSEVAPEYDLSRVSTKIHILYGTYDKLASVEVSFSKKNYSFYFGPNWHRFFNYFRTFHC